MVDETTISDYATNSPPLFRLTQEGDYTIIRAYDTNYPLWRVDGNIGGGVEVMTRSQRLSITPSDGQLIYDTTEDELYVGNGRTPGGVLVSGSGKIDVMTTTQRMSYTPSSGDLVFDSTEGKLYIGDGHTTGGIPVGADVPALLAMGDWTDELEDVYTPGDGVWTR